MPKSLHDITDEELQQVYDLAELFFSPRQIAIMLQLDIADVIMDIETPTSNLYEKFWAGRLQSELELRRSIVKLARSGSSPAQTMALDIFNKSKIEMLDR